jgi:hypothetical protein
MEDNFSDVSSDVTPTASAPASTGAADAPVSQGDSGALSTETAPSATTPVETGEAEAPELSIPENDDDLQGQANNPHVQAVLNLRQQLRQLNQDHKALRAQYQPLADFGDTDQITQHLEMLNGLYGHATDENGNIRYDQATGLPIPSTSQFVAKLQEGSPALVEQLFNDLWSTRRADGSTFAQEIFQRLGLDPKRLDDYVALTRNPSNAISSGIVPPNELAGIPEKFHDVYKSLSPSLRLQAQQMDDATLEEFLQTQQEAFESRKFRDEYRQQQEARQQAEMKQFWDGVDKSFEDYATKLRRDAFDSIQKGLTSQIQFSADPTINAVQTGAVMATLANLLDPNLRFATEGMLKSLGVTLDQGFDDALNALSQQAYLVKRYEAIAGNPQLAGYRNDAAMAQAQKEVNRLYQTTMAKMNGIAVKVAKALAGHNQGLREVEKSKLEAQARPSVGAGGLPSNSAKTPPPGVKPFTTEWLQWKQQAGG